MSNQSYADIICEIALSEIRRAPFKVYAMLKTDAWREGRCEACATMFPSIETLSASNEAQFLVRYHERHGVYQ